MIGRIVPEKQGGLDSTPRTLLFLKIPGPVIGLRCVERVKPCAKKWTWDDSSQNRSYTGGQYKQDKSKTGMKMFVREYVFRSQKSAA